MPEKRRFLNSSWSLLTMQITLAAVGIVYIAIWPRSGEAATLLPMRGSASPAAFQWLAREDAKIVRMTGEGAYATVIIPSQMSVVRALRAGLVPVSADPPACGG